MSKPQNDNEAAMLRRLQAIAGPADNEVSTACPWCNQRFVLLAHYRNGHWMLNCTVCPWQGEGELK